MAIAPFELQRLALGRLPRHQLSFPQDLHCQALADARRAVHQGTQAEQHQHVAGVERRWYAVQHVQGRPSAPQLAAVLDIVVNQKRVVHHLYGSGREDRLFEARAEGARMGDAQAWPHHLPAAPRVVQQQVLQIGSRRIGDEILLQNRPGGGAIFVQRLGDDRGGACHGLRSPRQMSAQARIRKRSVPIGSCVSRSMTAPL